MVKHSATDTLLAAPGESRVALRGMDWVAYCQMRSLLNERTRARLTCDRGTLEITTPSEAHEFYARLIERFIIILVGVPEFWRFNGRVWRIYELRDGEYGECDIPPTFPMVAKDDLYQFLTTCQADEVAAEINFRTWLRSQINNPSSVE